MRHFLPIIIISGTAACVQPVAEQAAPVFREGVPLRVLAAGTVLPAVRAELVASARAQFGSAALDRALSSDTYLIAKRFAGMSPPPPPGRDPRSPPPAPVALLLRSGTGWQVATAAGWRPASTGASATIDGLLAADRFWGEPTTVNACPDYGASNLVVKLRGRAESVRNAMCTSAAADLVGAALGA